MGTTPTQVLAFPNIRAIVRENGTAEVVVAGNSRVVAAGDSVQELRNNALALIVGEAQTLQRPVRVQIEDPDGQGELIVHPDNKIESVSYDPHQSRRRAEAPATTPRTVAPAIIETVPAPAPEPITSPVEPAPVPAPAADADHAPANPDPQTAVVAEEAVPTRRSLKETSFLVSAPVLEPATQGWRGTLTRLGFRMDPSEEELSERQDVRTVSQHWPGPRTIAVVNRKGGANKTPTVVMLSAILARYSGAASVAWDNNESQGTLGWRTEKGSHDRSVLDLIDSSTELLSPSTNAAEIAKFVHHQTADKFDVLRSDENEEGDHEVTAEEVDIAHQVLTRYYRLVVMDSGNTARAANWRRMIDHTNQLVVPVTAIEDRAEAARLTLQTLESRGGHDAELARNAVVIVSESTDAKRSMSGDALKRAKDEAQRIADGFEPFVRAVVRIPYDPALVNGPIRYEALQPATRRAWLAAAAAVAAGF
ncbi:chromosome partitioning protein ParA [Arthrobacter sp. AL08]|uniref:chromosome partitioning protein ParA n=1 Tax=unclassified Arthrobacter TaxID=235627 RepID=UPI00249B931C|nr:MULTISPECIES: chromosome partitioning protein ParA [unclassified Arthrobacter]MDI3243048.1 chromosome partitioning protein ParA [Arthrobacter sp. AL05]MDI3279058.1 chromosome partitioning protein ParA [Arthrobacter sp. AL08]